MMAGGAVPGFEYHVLKARLLQRWHFRHALGARLGRLREETQGSGLVVREQRGRPQEADQDMAGDEIVDGLAGAPIRHMLQFDARDLGEPFRQDVLVGADARRGKTHAGPRLRSRNEFGDRRDSERIVDREHQGLAR